VKFQRIAVCGKEESVIPEHDSGMFETNLSARSLFTDAWKPLPGRL
jgi:hypothetical protein